MAVASFYSFLWESISSKGSTFELHAALETGKYIKRASENEFFWLILICMKLLLYILTVTLGFQLSAQNWTTLNSAVGMGIAPPWAGFKLDAYRNDLWFVNKTFGPACLHLNTGLVSDVTYSGVGGDFDMAFTPDHVYFMAKFSGLYHVNADYTITNTYFANYNYHVYQNGDTVYMITDNSYVLAHTETGSILNQSGFYQITAKGTMFYPSLNVGSSLMKYTGFGTSGYQFYASLDQEYFCPQYNDIKFSPYSDTVYVGCARGITYACNYDFLDTISPFNTTNMPAANVFEFEFDKENRIWVTFGDSNNIPFAIARLDGSIWTNIYTAANSPIDFSKYRGMEIDTNGNIWVAENTKLHVWGTQTPQWLSVNEQHSLDVAVYPNPAQDVLTIDLHSAALARIQIQNELGQTLTTVTVESEQAQLDVSDLASGVYYVIIRSENGSAVKRVVK